MLMIYEISQDGKVNVPVDSQNPKIQEALKAAQEHYGRVGFKRPWVCFLAFEKGECVGSCGFKSPPKDGKVQIAYVPFPGQSQEVAADMVRKLHEITNFHDKNLTVTVRTPLEEKASSSLLKRLGFVNEGTVDDPQAGKMLEWGIQWSHRKFPEPV